MRLGFPRALFLLLSLFVATVLATAGTTSPAGPDGEWQRSILQSIRDSEYQFSGLEDGSWAAPNRAHDLRSIVTPEGLRVVPRTSAEQPWELRLDLIGFGRGASLVEPGLRIVSPSADGRRIEIVGPSVVEWYVNDRRGLEQGFSIPAPPQGERNTPVFLEMRIGGDTFAEAAGDGQAVEFRTASGKLALRYAKLVVTDANRKALTSAFELQADRLRIRVDDRDAEYPLLVDPLMTDPDWSAESNQFDAIFGISVASAGDVNQDGWDDVIVGAELYDKGQSNEGRVYVYLGSPAGLSTTPSWTAESDHTDARFGVTVASAGDVNGDGHDDVIIGAPQYDDGFDFDEGWAFVYYGNDSAQGLVGGTTAKPFEASWKAEGDQAGAGFGRSVASAGNVNGDGVDCGMPGISDVIIGAYEYTGNQSFEGTAYVFHGSFSDGLNPGGTRPTGNPANADWVGEGNQVDSEFGVAVASAGDVDNDGCDDVIVGARRHENTKDNEGRAWLFLGSPTGVEATDVWHVDGGVNDARLGVSVGSAGDVNGDGFDDVIIGADDYNSGQIDEGRALVFHGLSTALLGVNPSWSVESNQSFAFMGYSVASAGDFNGDGYGDVIVGADGYDDGEIDEGAAFLYYGSPTGLASAPSWTFEADVPAAEFGVSVASAGDVNGDGYDDVIIGADTFTRVEFEEGAAFVFHGCEDVDRDGICQVDDNCADIFNPTQDDTDTDGLGNVCDPCQDTDFDTVCDEPRVLVESSGPGEEVLVQYGSPMRYLPNIETVDPGIGLLWTQLAYNDLWWTLGLYGVGYETDGGQGAQLLLQATNPPFPGTISVYSRAQFIVVDKSEVETVTLGVDYDDGYVAWINGVEVYRSGEMPAGDPGHATQPIQGHESSNASEPDYTPLNDVTFNALPALKNGLNVLAIGAWNRGSSSSDLVLVPRLSINRPFTSTMKYLANTTNPNLGLDWVELAFDDTGWTDGNYGVGYELGTGAEKLINSEATDGSSSIYSRARFTLSVDSVDSMFLGLDYDDGYVAWINGEEVLRSPEMPGGVPQWNSDPTPHESSNGAEPDYGTLHDILPAAMPALEDGENVLVVGGWRNSTTGAEDLVVVPRLSINELNVDNCPTTYNPSQADLDEDGTGDLCDDDIDGDGVNNGGDNCPFAANTNQDDADEDDAGDVCDVCPGDANDDIDGDFICAGTDYNFPMLGDGDNCPADHNPPSDCDGDPETPDEQCNLDGDGLGDVCDPDIDNDGHDNDVDNCVFENNNQDNQDGDIYGDACDCDVNNNQAWEAPETIDTLLMVRSDVCVGFACSQTGGACVNDDGCEADRCGAFECSESGLPCIADSNCLSDQCEDFRCSAGDNPCFNDTDCTADFCTNRFCTEGFNPCGADDDCVADVCAGKSCLETEGPCTFHGDCPGGDGDLCLGQCSIGMNTCAEDTACVADVCAPGNCAVGLNSCTSDGDCTADACEGECTIGMNPCTSHAACIEDQTDLCGGTCSLGGGPCDTDLDCTLPQVDLCEGKCSIGGNVCTIDAACFAPDVDTLLWSAPADPGGVSLVFDALRSASGSDFTTSTTCLETDGGDTVAEDPFVPAAGQALYYLIRVENGCPTGAMGQDSAGVPRTGAICE